MAPEGWTPLIAGRPETVKGVDLITDFRADGRKKLKFDEIMKAQNERHPSNCLAPTAPQ